MKKKEEEQSAKLIRCGMGLVLGGVAALAVCFVFLLEEVGWKLFHFILDVASGKKKTFSDQWGLHNQLAVFNPAPVT